VRIVGFDNTRKGIFGLACQRSDDSQRQRQVLWRDAPSTSAAWWQDIGCGASIM